MKKSILDIDIIAVCQSACGSAGITANSHIGAILFRIILPSWVHELIFDLYLH